MHLTIGIALVLFLWGVGMQQVRIILCYVAAFCKAYAAVPYAFSAGSPISASQINANFSSVSSIVSSQWTTSSSSQIYYPGTVGVGTTAAAGYALNVNGNVSISGAVSVGGVGFNMSVLTGTLPGAGSSTIVPLPAGVLITNVISLSGIAKNTNGDRVSWVRFSELQWVVDWYLSAASNAVVISLPAGSTSAASKPYEMVIMYTPSATY